MKNITNYINMAINFSILGLLIYLTIVITNINCWFIRWLS